MTSRALALGFAGSMRTFTPVALFALRDRAGTRAGRLAVGLAVAELLTDKTVVARERNDLPSTAFRVTSGALLGGGAGAAAAFAGTHVTYHARRLLCAWTGLPDPVYAVAEDALAIGLAWWALTPLDGVAAGDQHV